MKAVIGGFLKGCGLARARLLIGSARGATLIMVAAASVLIFGVSGLALDTARAYLHRLRLVKAVDSAALMGAKSLRSGEAEAVAQALAAATANGVTSGVGGATVSTSVSMNEDGEATFGVTARQPLATTLMRILGIDELSVAAGAVAAIPPVDLVLVLDQSGSLGQVGAWDNLQMAAKDFIGYFDDDMDQLGLVSFQTRATNRFQIDHDFSKPIDRAIDRMWSAGWTDYGEGLRLAHAQITSADVRERSAKVVVFFTDGRPTAFRGTIGGRDRIMAAAQELPVRHLGGYYNDPDDLPSDGNAPTSGCNGFTYCSTWREQRAPQPAAADALNHTMGRQMANLIRGQNVFLYVIGLGNTSYSNPAFLLNKDFLRELANEGGATNSNQPAGKFYYAPNGDQLEAVFNQVARDLLVRLAQ